MASSQLPNDNRDTSTSLGLQDNQCILIDCHVHIYDGFNIDTFLASAWQNFYAQAKEVDAKDNFIGILLLTESQQHNWFKTLSSQSGGYLSPSSPWKLHETAEPYSLKVRDDQGKTLYLIAGRQIVTSERLEVLSLICYETFPDGRSAESTITSIQAAGGIAVLPWGVGKWFGKRGQIVSQLLQQHPSPVFLGDNSGRPQFWATPSYFSKSKRPILLGTDPLPLDNEACRPGKFGLMLMGELDTNEPGRDLKRHLLNPKAHWQGYGPLERAWQFIRNQAALKFKSQTPASLPMKIHDHPASDAFPEIADIETSSEDYATRFSGPTGVWLLKVQEIATLKMLATHPRAKVLDVGGGHGQLTKALIEQGYDVTVLGSAEQCRERIQSYVEQGKCQFQVGNVLDMPYANNTFDVVISYRFLAHVRQWQQFLKELTRVAGQSVIIDYPTVRSVNALAPALFKFKKGLEGNTRPFVCYREKEMTRFLQSLGWTHRQRYAQFFWPMVVHRTFGKPKLSSGLELIPRLIGLTRLLGSPVISEFRKFQQNT